MHSQRIATYNYHCMAPLQGFASGDVGLSALH